MPFGSARVHQSPISSKSHIGRVWPAMKAMTLPASSAEPPPKATTPSCPPALQGLETRVDVGLDRVRLDVGEHRGRQPARSAIERRLRGHRLRGQDRIGHEERRARCRRRGRPPPARRSRPAPKRTAVGIVPVAGGWTMRSSSLSERVAQVVGFRPGERLDSRGRDRLAPRPGVLDAGPGERRDRDSRSGS